MGKIMHGNIVYGGGSEVRPNPSDAATTDLTKIKIDGITYSIPDGEVADVKVDNVSVVDGNGIANINTMTGADGSAAGSKGLVPAPASTDNDKFLKGDGTWATPSGGGGSSTLAGLSDVDVQTTAPTDGQVLTYDYTNSKWVNEDPSGDEAIVLTKAQYNALTPAQQTDITKTYYITDESSNISGLNAIVDTLYNTHTTALGTYNLSGSIDDYDMLLVCGYNYVNGSSKNQFCSTVIYKDDYYINAKDGSGNDSGDVHLLGNMTGSTSGSNPRRVVFNFPTSTSIEVTIRSYASLDKIYGFKFLNQNVYSTTEQRIGTWIDGKPLYQKTIDFGVMPSSTTKSVAHGISNIKRVVSIEGYSFNSTAGNLTVPLPFVSTSALGSQMDIRCDFTNVTAITGTGRQNFAESFVTLRYTKITD